MTLYYYIKGEKKTTTKCGEENFYFCASWTHELMMMIMTKLGTYRARLHAAGRLHYRLLSVVPTGKDCVKRLKFEPIPLHY